MELTSDYDKFENSTKVSLRIAGSESGAAYFVFFFAGQKPKTPPKDILFQYFENSDNFLLPVKDFVVLADKTRLRIKLTQLPDINGKACFFTKIGYPTFLIIANSDSVEMKIGETESTFSSEALEALKDFASRTNSAFYTDSKTAQEKAFERQIKQETVDLLTISANKKVRIKEILELLQQAVTNAKESKNVGDILATSLGSFKFYLDNQEVLPNTLLKQLIENANGDLAASAIMRGIEAKILDGSKPDYKPLIEAAISENNLANVPENKRASILLSKAEESLHDANKLAAAAGIVEIE